MTAMKVSSHITVHKIDSETFCLFNQARFCPVRIQGSEDEVLSFVKKLQCGDIHGCGDNVIRLLGKHHILIASDETEWNVDEAKDVVSGCTAEETFTIRMQTRITDKKAVLRALDLVRERILQNGRGSANINVKFVCDDLQTASLYSVLGPTIKYIRDSFDFEWSRFSFYADVACTYVARHVDDLRMFIVPNLCFNLYSKGRISTEEIESFRLLVERWGFLLNVVFLVSRENIDDIKRSLCTMKDAFGREFRYSLGIPVHARFETEASYDFGLPSHDQIKDMLDFLSRGTAPDIEQNILYRRMKKNMMHYPGHSGCGICRGNAIYIDGQGRVGGCFLSSIRDAMSVLYPSNDAVGRILKSGEDSNQNMCSQCSLRHLCGGECGLIWGKNSDSVDRKAFSLRCQIRKFIINCLLREATRPRISAVPDMTYRFDTQGGVVRLIGEEPISV
jgi:radical SAM protein with 4Fe4S-binding SPASM domain